MNAWRLLIDFEVLDFLSSLPRRDHASLLKRFRDIGDNPSRYSDFVERDAVGRAVDVHVVGKFAIKYWLAHADRQVKVLDLHLADRT